jgi:uncharacterized membrane protein
LIPEDQFKQSFVVSKSMHATAYTFRNLQDEGEACPLSAPTIISSCAEVLNNQIEFSVNI